MTISAAKKWWTGTVLLLVLTVLPLGISGYWLRILTFIFMWIGLAASLNLLTGYTGYLDFGHVAFFGIGAYTTGILMLNVGFPFFPSMAAGILLAALFAVIMGIPTLRLRGSYFAIAMLAFAEAVKQVVTELENLTGGGNGLNLPIYTNYYFFYYMMFLAALSILSITFWFERSKFGLGLMAIRDAELAAEVTGVNTVFCKLVAFVISASTAGMIGGIYAYWMSFLSPGDAFSVLLTVRMIIMAFLGGAGTLLGPIIGATFLAAVEEVLWAQFKYSYLIIVGIVVVFVVIAMPKGIMGLIKKRDNPQKAARR